MTGPDEQREGDAEDPQAREDAAWAEIVAHYGERPDAASLDTPVPRPREDEPDPAAPTAPPDGPGAALRRERPTPEPGEGEERYVPPPPPPVLWPRGWRALAWAGVFGAPAILLALTVTGTDAPRAIDLALVAWFIGGFLSLVATMRDEPRDPWDDGSRV